MKRQQELMLPSKRMVHIYYIINFLFCGCETETWTAQFCWWRKSIPSVTYYSWTLAEEKSAQGLTLLKSCSRWVVEYMFRHASTPSQALQAINYKISVHMHCLVDTENEELQTCPLNRLDNGHNGGSMNEHEAQEGIFYLGLRKTPPHPPIN